MSTCFVQGMFLVAEDRNAAQETVCAFKKLTLYLENILIKHNELLMTLYDKGQNEHKRDVIKVGELFPRDRLAVLRFCVCHQPASLQSVNCSRSGFHLPGV